MGLDFKPRPLGGIKEDSRDFFVLVIIWTLFGFFSRLFLEEKKSICGFVRGDAAQCHLFFCTNFLHIYSAVWSTRV